jgi:hypothetical protein
MWSAKAGRTGIVLSTIGRAKEMEEELRREVEEYITAIQEKTWTRGEQVDHLWAMYDKYGMMTCEEEIMRQFKALGADVKGFSV